MVSCLATCFQPSAAKTILLFVPRNRFDESAWFGNKACSEQTVKHREACRSQRGGTTLEWYDFTVYNTLAALIFNRLFFPSFDPLVGTILAFSTYAVGYISRPIGGVVFGHLGDKLGRRFVLFVTVAIMGLTTGSMGLLPTYASGGTLSPILLVTLRFVQGIALGGEWAGA